MFCFLGRDDMSIIWRIFRNSNVLFMKRCLWIVSKYWIVGANRLAAIHYVNDEEIREKNIKYDDEMRWGDKHDWRIGFQFLKQSRKFESEFVLACLCITMAIYRMPFLYFLANKSRLMGSSVNRCSISASSVNKWNDLKSVVTKRFDYFGIVELSVD